MAPRVGLASLLALAGLLVLAGAAAAEQPRPADWDSQEVPGAPVDAGFLAAGLFAHGTTDAQALLQGPGGACQDEETELYLFSGPQGDGCLQAIDVDGTDSERDGLSALATAERAPAVYAAPDTADELTGSAPDVAAYDLQNRTLTASWTASFQGFAAELDAAQNGSTVAAVVQDGTDPDSASYELRAYAEDGSRTHRISLLDRVHAMDLSRNGDWAVVAGSTVRDGDTTGWVQLIDLSRSSNANPVAEELFPGEGNVLESAAVTDDGLALVGARDGTVTTIRADASPQSTDTGDATAHVATTRRGAVLVAATGDTVTRLEVDEGLQTRWTRSIDGSASDAIARGPYVLALADQVEGFHRSGTSLWSLPAGELFATNRTGLSLVLASPTTRSDGTGSGIEQDASNVTAREVHRNATLVQASDVPTVTPGSIGEVNLTLSNEGAAVLAGSLTRAGQVPVDVTFTPKNLTLLPDDERTVQANLAPSENARPGLRDIPIRFASTPFVDARTNVTLDVGPTINLTLRPEPGTLSERSVTQGQNLTVRFLLGNQGNTDATPNLGVRQSTSAGDAWDATLTPSGSVQVPAGSTTTVRLELEVPPDARDGTENRLVVRAATDTGSTAAALSFTVNPFQALEVLPETATKKMAPGGTNSYTFTVENLGSVEADAELDATPIDETGDLYVAQGWGVVLDRSTVALEPGARETVTLDLTAPANASVNPSIRVQVSANTSQAEASALAYGVVDPSLAEADEDEPRREPLPWIAGIVALTVATALKRRPKDGNL